MYCVMCVNLNRSQFYNNHTLPNKPCCMFVFLWTTIFPHRASLNLALLLAVTVEIECSIKACFPKGFTSTYCAMRNIQPLDKCLLFVYSMEFNWTSVLLITTLQRQLEEKMLQIFEQQKTLPVRNPNSKKYLKYCRFC